MLKRANPSFYIAFLANSCSYECILKTVELEMKARWLWKKASHCIYSVKWPSSNKVHTEQDRKESLGVLKSMHRTQTKKCTRKKSTLRFNSFSWPQQPLHDMFQWSLEPLFINLMMILQWEGDGAYCTWGVIVLAGLGNKEHCTIIVLSSTVCFIWRSPCISHWSPQGQEFSKCYKKQTNIRSLFFNYVQNASNVYLY